MKFANFAEFYPFYLSQHRQPGCRACHYVGSGLVLAVLTWLLLSQQWQLAWLLPLVGYGFAWLGHFFIEHNRPATFQHPWYSLVADWVMLKDWLSGQLQAKLAAIKPEC